MSQKLILNNVPDEVVAKLDQRAKAQGVPRASVIKALLFDFTGRTETAQKGDKKAEA
jgi:predicted transcriptional regulator